MNYASMLIEVNGKKQTLCMDHAREAVEMLGGSAIQPIPLESRIKCAECSDRHLDN